MIRAATNIHFIFQLQELHYFFTDSSQESFTDAFPVNALSNAYKFLNTLFHNILHDILLKLINFYIPSN
ncbi:hypothetical protein CBEIBR21_02690 [Clostridium beijerinckii]|uniref:Uncharacterized protein n=1 Tax=Clostridium beijerinckii TaxID=1520 RepID=A0A1S9NC91_CLOBE|nr:hypothetical protein CBEIBR21_02690 [Clostridium beijerinckii]